MRTAFFAGLMAAFALCLAFAHDARAFCGFYVAGGDTRLLNEATQVVLMREGTRTVLSMANHYQGPPEDFAMVVPVPVVLRKGNVRTLPPEIFAQIDELTAPRLVEYWEQDPCPRPMPQSDYPQAMPAMAPPPDELETSSRREESHGVHIEARFSVGEYEILILSARDSVGLDTWLHERAYKIPAGAEPLLRPYVQMGMKFFVAKVDVSKVRHETIGGRSVMRLSPLRFHYDSDAFMLPIRLGLVNSGGTQDLIVQILARGQRYEASNYDNVAIPTNLDLAEEAKGHFAEAYAALFDATIAHTPRAVVTEYSWQAQSCDPCPGPVLQPDDLATLGADAIWDEEDMPNNMSDFVVTRLHMRYGSDTLGDDLFFRPAPPIEGGRENWVREGVLEQGAKPGSVNDFQARYAIRHPWTGPIECEHPRRGVWGGPTGPQYGAAPTQAAKDLAFVSRGHVDLMALIRSPLPDGIVLSSGGSTPPFKVPPGSGGCAGCSVRDGDAEAGGALACLVCFAFMARRRRTERR